MRGVELSAGLQGSVAKIPKLVFANIQGLRTTNRKDKTTRLSEIAREENAIIIAITESHLREETLSAEVEIPGFYIQRMDRAGQIKKGGVAFYFREDIVQQFGSMQGGSRSNIEYLCSYSPRWNLVVAIVYRPEGTAEFEAVMNEIAVYANLRGPPMPNLVILGDFNFPQIDWNTGATRWAGKSAEEKRRALHLLDWSEHFCLTQVIEEPTRGDNVLDLILTNNTDMILSSAVTDPGISDHRVIVASLAMPGSMEDDERGQNRETPFSSMNFHSDRIDWTELSLAIARAFEGSDPRRTAEEQYESFVENVRVCCQNRIPAKRTYSRRKIPRDRKILMRKRRKLQHRVSATPLATAGRLQAKIADINEKLRQSINAELEREERRAVETVKNNSKYFFSYAKRRTKLKTSIGPLERNGEMICGSREMAEELQRHYSEVYTVPRFSDVTELVKSWSGPNREAETREVDISDSNIKDSILKLSNNSAAGPDGIPAILLRKCADSVARPLANLWKASLDSGVVPARLKEGNVTPIFKGGKKGDSANYRPVVLTSHVAKVFERIVADKLMTHLDEEGLISDSQHGFRRGRSCASQLLQHYQGILRALESGCDADVIYLDFSKAFDKVDHGLLLCKLMNLGITGPIVEWLKSFLCDRKQRVVVGGNTSSWTRVKSGVPQGTVLGPILFLVSIIDIDTGIKSTMSSFADDTRVFGRITGDVDRRVLQEDLERVYEWAEANNMAFNDDKFKVLQYKAGRGSSAPGLYFSPGGAEIEGVPSLRDLGVQMTDSAKFDEQIDKVIKKSRQMMGWMLRSFKTREPKPMLILYKAVVLPHLDYCCQLWSPKTLGDIRRVEGVQRTFTARLKGMEALNYWDRLSVLGLYSLERRRERYMALYMWKMIKGITPMILSGTDPEVTQVDSQRRGRHCVIPKIDRRAPAVVQTLLENSLPVRGSRIFNTLPRSLREWEGGLQSFKSRLDKYLRSVPDRPYLPHYYLTSQTNSLAVSLK